MLLLNKYIINDFYKMHRKWFHLENYFIKMIHLKWICYDFQIYNL